MAHTDHHAPRRLWDHYGLTYNRTYRLWYAPLHSSPAKPWAQLVNRRDRRTARGDLRRGVEPMPPRRWTAQNYIW